MGFSNKGSNQGNHGSLDKLARQNLETNIYEVIERAANDIFKDQS